MGKMAKAVSIIREKEIKKPVTNFMGGTSYGLSPLETMRMITASSIFGEPQYYRDGKFAGKTLHKDGTFGIDRYMADYVLKELDVHKGKRTSEIMEDVIDDALRCDFKATIEYAVELRKTFLMRLNPQIIMIRAAIMTEQRTHFTEKYPGLFDEINQKVMSRADDVTAQITYCLFLHDGKKNHIPGILKNSWKRRIERMTRYELNKYANSNIGLINAVRICHAHNADIAELMTSGKITVQERDDTCERLRVSGKSWREIIGTIDLNHMTLLKNLRGICKEIKEPQMIKEQLARLERGVSYGKQFPYRYLSAYNAVKTSDGNPNETAVLDSLENCMDIACKNLPKLAGNNAFLSDNSGSAWSAFPSEYGTMTVARIGNLSSVIGAVNSERGTVFTFGDRLIEHQISKRAGILQQAEEISEHDKNLVGMSTENGVWLFFEKAIDDAVHYDNIFIYSDMQAGHGELYGTRYDANNYEKRGFAVNEYSLAKYIDVAKLIQEYRSKVNPKVNVYCIQTAGYDNVMVPENGYRTNILYGWTGKELVYADAMNAFWDEYDARRRQRAETA